MEMCYQGTLAMPKSYAVMDQDEMMYVEGGGPRMDRLAERRAAEAALKKTITKNLVGGVATLVTVAHHHYHTSYKVNVRRRGRIYVVTYNAPTSCSIPQVAKYIIGQLSWV